MDGGSNGCGNGLQGEFNKLYLPDITESWYIYQVFRNLLLTNCYLFLLGCNVVVAPKKKCMRVVGATPIDSVDITEVLMREESLIPDRTACAIQAHAVWSVWEMNLNCWMLPLATCCHIHYHLHPFHFVLFKFKQLVVKQHPTNKKNPGTFTRCLETCN